MKKFLIATAALMLFLAANAENQTVKFSVNPPLVCNNCENKVKDNLRFEKGVKGVKPSAKKGEVEVTYDDSKTDVEHLKEGFKKIGYDATVIEPEVCPEEGATPACCTQQPESACCAEQSK